MMTLMLRSCGPLPILHRLCQSYFTCLNNTLFIKEIVENVIKLEHQLKLIDTWFLFFEMPLNAPENAIKLLRTLSFVIVRRNKKLCLRVLSLLTLDSSFQKLVRNQVRRPHVWICTAHHRTTGEATTKSGNITHWSEAGKCCHHHAQSLYTHKRRCLLYK